MCSHSLPACHQAMERGNLGLNEVQSSSLSLQTGLPSSCTLIHSWLRFACLSLWPLTFGSLQRLNNILFSVISLFVRNRYECFTKPCLFRQLLSSAMLNVRSPLSLGFRGSSTVCRPTLSPNMHSRWQLLPWGQWGLSPAETYPC